MTPFVLDAGVAIGWFFPESEEERAYAAAVLRLIREGDSLAVVPQHFHVEVAAFLLRRRRTKGARFGAAALEGVLNALDGLPIETRLIQYDARGLVKLAQEFHIQPKDAPYFQIAQGRGLPLATIDGGLVTACRVFNVDRMVFH